MIPPWRKNAARLLGFAAAFAALSCGDRTTPTGPRTLTPGGASKDIWDGAHNGNDDVWFLPPMVSSPAGKPGYGDPFAANLPVVIKVVDVDQGNKILVGVTATTESDADQLYQANWDTKNTTDNNPLADRYQVQVLIGTKIIAFADANLVSNGSQVKNTAGDIVTLADGRTLPIKVRVEQGWNCYNNSTCVSQVVPATIPTGTTVTVTTNDGKDWITFQGDGTTGNWNTDGVAAVVTVEDVSAQLGGTAVGCAQNLTRMVVDGHCIKITTDPEITLTTSATVCMTLASYQDDWKLLKFDTDETTKFLGDPPAGACPTRAPTIGSANQSSNPLVRLASLVGNTLWRLVTPNIAYAFDLGVGGLLLSGDSFSYFAPGRPAQMNKIAGDNQSAPAGTVLPTAPAVQIVTTHNGSTPVGGATVTCTPSAGSGSIAGTGVALESPSGTYTCPSWTLGAAGGTNTLVVTASNLDPTAAGGSATFTATGGAVTSVAVTPATATVAAGQTVALAANVTVLGGASTAVTWSSSDPSKATVSATGVVTGVAAGGPVTITATSVYDNTKSGTAAITVTCATVCITSFTPTSTNVILESADPAVNYTITLHNSTSVTQTGVAIQGYLIQETTNRAAGGSSGCPLSVSGDVAPGDCTMTRVISASNSNGGTGTLVPGPAQFLLELRQGSALLDSRTLAVTLSAPPSVSISVSPQAGVVDVGNTLSLAATVIASSGVSTAVTWFSSNPAIASVNASGLVTGISAGSVVITARSNANITQSASVAITVQAAGTGTFIGSFGISNNVAILPSNPSGQWTATVINPAGALGLQGVWVQGTNTWPSGGTTVTCPATGPCVVTFSYATSNVNGIGPLVPGAATLRLDLINDATSATLDSKSIPVTLVVP